MLNVAIYSGKNIKVSCTFNQNLSKKLKIANEQNAEGVYFQRQLSDLVAWSEDKKSPKYIFDVQAMFV